MIAYCKSKIGYKLNHKGVWYTLTGYFNGGYWQAITPTKAVTWVRCVLSGYTDYKVNNIINM